MGGKKPKIKIFKEWRKYLKCPMCEELSKELSRRTKKLRQQPEHKGFDWSEGNSFSNNFSFIFHEIPQPCFCDILCPRFFEKQL